MFDKVALIMGDVRTTQPDGLGSINRVEEGGALMVESNDLRADTGQMGEELRRGI